MNRAITSQPEIKLQLVFVGIFAAMLVLALAASLF
ncbi:MAG: hypothetical protein H6Q20_1737 [Bacteroidetes bacterium]|jgi:hypothetical protein|nr:hypothetical protein [Bacteroidota bacterium]